MTMKTSKIIFISFFGLLGLFLLSLLIQVPHDIPAQTEVHETSLTGIRNVFISNRYGVRLEQGDRDKVFFYYVEGQKPEVLPFRISNDTLIIDSLGQNQIGELFLNLSSFQKIDLANSEISLNNYKKSFMTIDGIKSRVHFNECTIDSLYLHLKADSELWTDNQAFAFLSVILDRSRGEFYSDRIRELQAVLRDNAELSVYKVNKSQVDSDESSRFYSR